MRCSVHGDLSRIDVRDARKRLLRWYRSNARDLPWRSCPEPYGILVSEFMLQQTQVGRVLEYFPRWVARFPDLATLASANRRDVLVAWAGLGYNRRALLLHDAAKTLVERFGGNIPRDIETLRQLPGVGRYTARAIASFAFGVRTAVVDTNVRRVVIRYFGLTIGPNPSATARQVETLAEHLLPPRAYVRWNHAMMDLGALVCTSRRASCAKCPLAFSCRSAGSITPPERRSTPKETIPRRIWRGRIMSILLSRPPLYRATYKEIERALQEGFPRDPQPYLPDVLMSLARDGMVSIPSMSHHGLRSGFRGFIRLAE
ncbi:MAG: A/G-specific adenine glycosylase [Bacteroidota bacterium]|nr:A/G-specific adenine glycosylase [Bacteroidota bacterium]